MNRQNSDTPREARIAMLQPQARQARERRVEELKALVQAGLYRVDAGALARAILRAGRLTAAPMRRPPARFLDMRVSA